MCYVESTVHVRGRFAPSPTGRMHLGNIFTALISWLSVRKAGGEWLLRIEDLDAGRSRLEYAQLIEDDLHWLGLDWDEGGLAGAGSYGPYRQSERGEIYSKYLADLAHLTYPCTCTRADLMATNAPHQADGRVIYPGTCRPDKFPAAQPERPASTRICVPSAEIAFEDRVYGLQMVCLDRECGDFMLRRSDGNWAYQFAVVVDDALMGVTEVVRGSDLLVSAAQQIFLYRQLGFQVPQFAHVPLLCSAETGRRLSKRDKSLSMEYLRKRYTPESLLGYLAMLAGLQSRADAISARELIGLFDWQKVPRRLTHQILVDEILF